MSSKLCIFFFIFHTALFCSLPLTHMEFSHWDEKFSEAITNSALNFPNSNKFWRRYNDILRFYKRGTGRAFNWSIAPINSEEPGYLISVRITASSRDEKIIPGNCATSTFEKGNNFWWMNWTDSAFSEATYFFYADHNLENLQLLMPQETLDEAQHMFIHAGDMRLVERNGNTYAYRALQPSPLSHFGFRVAVENGIIYFTDAIANINIGRPYKNWPIVLIDNTSLMALDWFYEGGVQFVLAGQKTGIGLLPQSDPNFPFIGDVITQQADAKNNVGLLPLVSFASPTIQLDEKNFLGVGTVKIITDPRHDILFSYEPNSPIATFRAKLYEDMKQLFKDKYIRHHASSSDIGPLACIGFSYLLYFYHVELNDENMPAAIRLSDAFLPINLGANGDGKNYKFSLYFPSGLVRTGDNEIMISAGYGDYYSVALKFKLDEAKNSCRHNATRMDMRNFSYWVLHGENGNFIASPRLLEEGIQSEMRQGKPCQNPLCSHKNAKRRCSRCKATNYCSIACQKQDWQRHKQMCHEAR